MENYKGGLKAYWRRRAYERLDTPRRRRVGRAELGDGGRRRRRFWRIPARPKLHVLRRFSLKRFFARIRDAYVGMMLRLASSAGGGVGLGYGSEVFGAPQLKEYDEKVIVEIYRSLVAQGHLFAAAGGGGGGGGGGDAQVALRR